MPDGRTQLSVRIDPGLHERLKAEAHSRVCSVNRIVTAAVEGWLDRHEHEDVPRETSDGPR